MINGVITKELKIIRDERGQVMHMMRRDDDFFTAFGEVYFSVTNPGVIKGWKRHLRMTQHFAVPQGEIRLVIYDDRPQSPTRGQTQEILLGQAHYQLVRVPPLVWYAFGCLGKTPAMMANCSDMPHDPQESQSIPLGDARIPYQWK